MASPTILSRSSITACRRCRQRKQKCDQRLPKCRSCEKAGIECVGYDAVTKRDVPRSYVHSLEERVAFLELRLQSLGHPVDGDLGQGRSPTGRQERHQPRDEAPLNERGVRVGMSIEIPTSVTSEILLESMRDAPFTKFLLSDLQKAEATFGLLSLDGNVNRPSGLQGSIGFELPKILDTSPISLPERSVADQLTKCYFEFSNFSAPLLHEPTFRRKLALVYSLPEVTNLKEEDHESRRALFFTYMVLAVGLLILQKHDATDIPLSQCERYYAGALCCLETIGLPADLESVQILMLIAQYSCFRPSFFGIYKTVGMAMRLAVELGLNQDLSPGEGDPLAVDTRRRVFWSAYAMDRHMGVIFARPFCLDDGAIDVQFPSPHNDEHITEDGIMASDSTPMGKKVFGVHYFRYRQLQSDIQVVLRQRKPGIYVPIDYIAWQEDMRKRLDHWFSSAPKDVCPSIIAPIETLELSYLQGLIHLYRPSLMIPNPAAPALIKLAETASTIIKLRQRVHRENKVRMFWMNFHNIFAAGVTLLDCYSRSPEVRDRISLREIEASVHACSAVMWAMVERFPAAKVKRDAFDAFAKTSLDSLATAGSTNAESDEISPVPNSTILFSELPIWDASKPFSSGDLSMTHSGTNSSSFTNELSTGLPIYGMAGPENFLDENGEFRSWDDPQCGWMNNDFNPTLYSNLV